MTTTFGLASDLHLDFGKINPEFFDWQGDVLLLAGDIAEDDNLRKMNQFWFQVSHMATDVFVVTGNHEYYCSEIDTADDHLREYFQKFPNIKLLQNEVADVGNFKIFGSTFWTDYNDNPMAEHEAQRCMADFRLIRQASTGYSTIRPVYIKQQNLIAKNILRDTLEANLDQNFIVMTHHAPSFQSIATAYKNSGNLNHAFVNDLDDLIVDHPNILAWVHGHTHSYFDYQIEQCRVMCNPHGYPHERPTHLPPYQPITFTL